MTPAATTPKTSTVPMIPPVSPITARIADAIADGGRTSAELDALRAEAVEVLATMREGEGDCRGQALDPASSAAEARAAREIADDFAHEALRLQAAIVTIEQVLPALKAAEHQEQLRPAYERYRAEREAFIDRLRKRWPALASEMVGLLQEIERYRQGPQIEIPEGADPLRDDIEAIARNCPGHFYIQLAGGGAVPVVKLSAAVIPAFDVSPTAPQYLWARGPKRD